MSDPRVPEAPVPARREVVRTLHGETAVDPYRWMQERESREVLAHLRDENAWTEGRLAHLAPLRETLFREIKSRIQETDWSVPARKGDWWYLTRSEEGRQYPISCRRRGGPEGPEQVVLDGNELAGDSDYFAIGLLEPSPDDALVAYSTDYSGAERYTLRFRDLATGKDLEDEIPDTYYGGAWSREGTHFFYTRPDETVRPHRLWRHRLGTPASEDVLVLEENDEHFYLDVHATRSEDWILVTLHSLTTTEVWMIDAASPESEPRRIRAREPGVEYWVDHQRRLPGEREGGGHLIVLTTHEAPNGRVLRAPVERPDAWEEIVPHRTEVKIEDVDAFAEHLVLWSRRDATSGIEVLPAAGGPLRELAFDEAVRSVDAGENLEYDTNTLRFLYESLVTPRTVFEEDLATGERRLLKQQPVLGGYRPEQWESRREWATTADGERIPISLVQRRGAPRDGSSPLLLYGYGAYEANSDPWFSAGRLSLLERGVAFAIAHVRGGGELGRRWHEDGRLAHKRNSFGDMVACAEHLVETGWTRPDRLAIRGRSAGGLLVGATLNLRPDLFRAAVAEVPFVDVVNTMLDETLPLTVTEWEEWGNPKIEEQYRWIRAYDPYQNIQAVPYPRILATGGLNDPRVQYWEPAKWVAALRERTTGREPILLKTDLGAGHGGPSGRYDAWREEALVLAFLLDAFGLAEAPAPAAEGGPGAC